MKNRIEFLENQIKKTKIYMSKQENNLSYFEDKHTWCQIFSCFYALEDSLSAIKYYINNEYPNNIDGKYLYLYGILQAFFIQQDAINNLHIAFKGKKIDYKNEYPEIYEIREVRNDVIGHPTNRNRNNSKEFIKLSQFSLSKYAFSYNINKSNGTIKTSFIDLSKVIITQIEIETRIIKEINDELNKKERQYFDLYKKIKISSFFNKLNYAREKGLEKTEMRSYALDVIEDILKKVKEEYSKRYINWENVDIKFLIKDISEVLNILKTKMHLIDNSIYEPVNKHLMYSMFNLLDDLRKYAEETDKWFENNGVEMSTNTNNEISFIFTGEDELED